ETANTKQFQMDLFINQIELAKKLKLPIIIHSRDALDDTLEILNNYFCGDNLNGVWHCFCYDMITFEKIKNLGFMISVGGLVTYSNLKDLKHVVKNMDLDYLLLETDAPYLTPSQVKNAGIDINEPMYVKTIAEYIAKLRNVDYSIIEEATTRNAKKLFKL
ncbi:MAG: TatD family hydrolase, partial [Romboutsia sp.]|nr:TatD family hydrolase [Romboutsia sp.]